MGRYQGDDPGGAPQFGPTPRFHLAGPTWFFWYDLATPAAFVHPTLFVFIDVATGAVSVSQQEWWPVIDGAPFLALAEDRQQTDLAVFRKEPPEATGSASPGQRGIVWTSTRGSTDVSQPIQRRIALQPALPPRVSPADQDCRGKLAFVLRFSDEGQFKGDETEMLRYLMQGPYADASVLGGRINSKAPRSLFHKPVAAEDHCD